MSTDLEDLKRRLVLRHKPGGRCVYDVTAKAEFVELCLQPGVSVSRLAREVGINANQVSRWLRERGQGRKAPTTPRTLPLPSPFVAVPVLAPPMTRVAREIDEGRGLNLHATLPNGVRVELRGAESCHIADVILALGRLPCSDSTNI